MATQNLVSASISEEMKSAILEQIADIRSKLGFLTSLRSDEIHGLVKVGNNYAPFLEKAHAAATEHPDIMSKLFDIEEFKKDYRLSKDLGAISRQLNQLTESVQNTCTAVNSDAMVAALEIYNAVKLQSDRVPGLKVVYGEMSEFFKRPKRKETAAKA